MMFKSLILHFPFWNRQAVFWRFTTETELSFALRAMLQSSIFSIKNSVVSHSQGEIKKACKIINAFFFFKLRIRLLKLTTFFKS